MSFDMQQHAVKAKNVRIAFRTARNSVQALINEPMESLEAFAFLDRELLELQRDVWQLWQAREKWKDAQRHSVRREGGA